MPGLASTSGFLTRYSFILLSQFFQPPFPNPSISPRGILFSRMAQFLLQESPAGVTYMYEMHPDITAISHSTGSQAGGLLLTITGKGFASTVRPLPQPLLNRRGL